jgi:hypothetical protein
VAGQLALIAHGNCQTSRALTRVRTWEAPTGHPARRWKDGWLSSIKPGGRSIAGDKSKESIMPKRRIGPATLDALSGLPLFATAPLYRHWHLRWGATHDEVHGSMAGDEIVPNPSFNATRAITIDAPPELVWPWIVQMGYRRAGFYTYALLDNAGYDSADRILEEYQPPKSGDWMPMAKQVNETTAFRVQAFELNRWLLWEKPDSTWAWKLLPLHGGRTRLILRLKQRYAWERPGSAILTLVLLEFGDFPMMRRVLKGIKVRAERMSAARSTAAAIT